MTEAVAERILRDVARDTGRLANTVQYGANQAMYELISNAQIKQCLESGRVTRPPVKDELGNWICESYKLCSGVDVYVTTAIRYEGDEQSAVVYVLKVNNRAEP